MPHQRRIKIKSHIILSMLIFTFCLSLCFGAVKMTAHADNEDFNVDVQLISSDGETFDISVTVENAGDDWEGVARLLIVDYTHYGAHDHYLDCVYDTALSLPQGSVKQFVVKIPKYSYINLFASLEARDIEVRLIDKNEETVFSKGFEEILLDTRYTLHVRTLSDDYPIYQLYYEKEEGNNLRESHLSALGNDGGTLSFTALKFIIIIYVILAGPVLYLVLRHLKKRDLYWAAVPALAFMGVIIVMFAGRGFEIRQKKVYSVTVCDLSGVEDCITYMHCYGAGYDEWKLRLNKDYEYAGPVLIDEEYTPSYYYRMLQEGGRLFFGVKPYRSFADAYFYAGKIADTQGVGSIECDVDLSNKTVNEITNNTEYDFEYIAVVDTNHIRVYNGIAAGESCSPDKMKEIFQINTGGYYLKYYYMSNAQDAMKTDNLDSIAALGVGIDSAYVYVGGDRVAVVGVTPNYIKAVDDNCKEEAYGCFYIIQ
ncbi:MAG: hypothetical protein NC433_12545 [Clostridiales bacterium]|nr:hypothetical protein [Clostridiales bacterium]